MTKKTPRIILDLIPFYVNDTLAKKEIKVVQDAIDRDAKAGEVKSSWHKIRLIMIHQEQAEPSSAVLPRILSAIHEPVVRRSVHIGYRALAGTGLALLVFVILWSVVQPGVLLPWSVKHDGMIIYRIYRAPRDSDNFQLIKEISGQSDRVKYRYVDALLIPGQSYIYRVEGIPKNGTPAYSEEVHGNYLEILPGQLALLITSLITGYGIVFFIQAWPKPLQKARPGLTI